MSIKKGRVCSAWLHVSLNLGEGAEQHYKRRFLRQSWWYTLEHGNHVNWSSLGVLQVKEGITIADYTLPDMPLIYANRSFSSITGYATAEVLGRNCRWVETGQAMSGDARLVGPVRG